MTNSRGRVGVTTNTAPTSSTSSHRVDRKEDLELCSNPTAIEKAAQFAKDASGDAVNSFSKITGLAFTQRKFKKQVSFGPNKRYSPDTINWDEEAEIRTSGGATDMGEEKETEIIELHHQLEIQNSTICRILKAATTQTEPVQDEAFDWDLSDKMEVETQTMPSSRTNSIYNGETSIDVAFFLQDAIVQTDQRLAFLLKRSAKNEQRRNSSRRIRLHDAWCQTHIEVQEIGVQVTPSEFDSGDEDTSSSGFSEDSVGKVRVKKRDLTFAQVHAEAEARRQAGAVRPKTFKPTRLSSAAQDMLTDARAIEQLLSVTASFRSQSDAGFQVNLSSDAGIAVAKHTSRRGDISSPVGESLLKSLHFQESLEGINYGEKKNSSGLATAKGRNARTKSNKDLVKVDVAIQTENDIITDVSSTFEAVPSPMRKYELIGDDPNVFADIDAWVVELSKKWYKSLKTVVKRLNSRIIGQSKYKGIEELIKTRAYFRWVAENIV
ncbi:hypothetical protein TCAL_01529 [Tigriopus californicus]|uniref:Uncharacterized protein n=1 Tax=Tigriopus californicus TaxID=6832 RepID=A0A553P897_TIGCA|nr:hypothetical protein TCAL_01529 [Tigriopus californicus]